MIINATTTSNGKTAYSFEANRTEYTVVQDEPNRFTVISHRKGLRFPTLNVHTRDELVKRSKALAALVAFIETPAAAA